MISSYLWSHLNCRVPEENLTGLHRHTQQHRLGLRVGRQRQDLLLQGIKTIYSYSNIKLQSKHFWIFQRAPRTGSLTPRGSRRCARCTPARRPTGTCPPASRPPSSGRTATHTSSTTMSTTGEHVRRVACILHRHSVSQSQLLLYLEDLN